MGTTMTETTVRLRDVRKPGHGWYDNEIYDVFGDELRQDGISVYTALTRLCYGTKVTMSLREMAEHARMSKDTFGRNLKRVVELGLVIERKGATPQSPSSYELADVKELAANYLRRTVSEQSRKSVSPRDTRPATTLAQLVTGRAKELAATAEDEAQKCLTLRQIDGVDKKIWVGDSATEVSQNDPHFATEVSQAVRHLRQDTRHKTQDKYNPPTPASGGVSSIADAAREDEDESQGAVRVAGELVRFDAGVMMGPEFLECNLAVNEAARVQSAVQSVTPGMKRAALIVWQTARVMRDCGWTKNRRLEEAIGEALEMFCSSEKSEPVAAADLMIGNAKMFLRERPALSHGWSWLNFVRGNYWRDSRSWPYDKAAVKELDLKQKAGIGMWDGRSSSNY
jgi:hypothetical protein